MAAHWKFGNGFAIRYGGKSDIKWFFDDKFKESVQSTVSSSTMSLASENPAMIGLEILKIAGIYLQWWEMRKQTLLQSSQFEERRITWLADMISQLFVEMRDEKELRTDTVYFLDREITRLFNKIKENDLIDLPSSLLLQINRTANFLVNMNIVLDGLRPGNVNFTLPGRVESIENHFVYHPYYELLQESSKLNSYLESGFRILDRSSLLMAAPGGLILWGANQLFKFIKLNKEIKDEERLQDFSPLTYLSLELRSTSVLLSLLQSQPLSIKSYSTEEIENNSEGSLILLES